MLLCLIVQTYVKKFPCMKMRLKNLNKPETRRVFAGLRINFGNSGHISTNHHMMAVKNRKVEENRKTGNGRKVEEKNK